MTVRKIALNVVKTEGYNSGSIDILARWVFVETDNNDRSDTVYGNVEFPYSSYGEYAWMTSIQCKGYTSKRNYGENKGAWLEHGYDLGATFDNAPIGRIEDTCKKLRSFETKLSKYTEKFGSQDSFAEFLFRLAIVSKCDFILTEKRQESGYNYRANLVDGDGKLYLKSVCELPKPEVIAIETE